MQENHINAICKKIADEISENMKGAIETMGDYGFKCVKEAFKIATAIKASDIYYDKEQQCSEK